MSLPENTIDVAGKPHTLAEIELYTWQSLLGSPGFRTAVIATVALQSEALTGVSQRTVVIREVNPAQKTIFFHTDLRADKVRELVANPVLGLLFYDEATKIQVRLNAKVVLHTEGQLADLHWQKTPLGSRKNYCAVDKPGSPLSLPHSGSPFFPEGREISQEESEKGRANFMVIACQVWRVDWLYLHPVGHRRAQFTYENDHVEATWVIP